LIRGLGGGRGVEVRADRQRKRASRRMGGSVSDAEGSEEDTTVEINRYSTWNED
jgi:hypothetical protein